MRVFLKYIIKSMLEKKGRFFLLIFSIMVSTALLVFSAGTVDVILDGYTDTLKNTADGKDVAIYSNTEDVFFSEDDFDSADLRDFEGELDSMGVINKDDKITYITIRGKENCNKYMIEGEMPENSSEAYCIISERTADERDLEVGSTIDININGEKHTFTVKGICAPKGTFYADTESNFDMVVPYGFMNELLGAEGRYNYGRAGITGSDSVKAADDFNEVNERVKAASITDLSYYKTMVQSTQSTVYIMFSIVCIICCIIIYGAFKLIITERMTVIGTFMSQGATKKKISRILLAESVLYSVIGAVFGIVLGEVILYFVNRYASPLSDYGIYMDFHVKPSLIVLGIVFAVLMSVVSAWIPIRSIKKLPVKDVILNRLEVKHKKGAVRFIIGAILLTIAVFGAVCKGSWTEAASIPLVAAAFIGIIMLLRKFLKILSGALSRVFRKNTSIFLALNNIKSSKLLRGNITLLVISLSAILSIASVGTSMTDVVTKAYEEMSFDYNVYNIIGNNSDPTTTDILMEKLAALDCVNNDSLASIYDAMGTVDDTPIMIEAVDPIKYADYNKYLKLKSDEYWDDVQELAASDDNAVMITDYISKVTGKEKGDNIEINVDNKVESFRVVGTFNGKLYNNGSVIIMKQETIKRVYNIKEAGNIIFRINGDADAAEAEFKGFLADLGATYISRDDAMADNVEANKMITKLLSVFAYLAMVVASIGIFNNIAISFQQRRREFAVMASVGMNGKKRRRLVLAENMFCVIWSIVISIPFTLLLTKLFSKLLVQLNLPMEITFDWAAVPQYSVVLALVIFIASLSTMKKSKKINVVQELKYE